MSRHANRVDQVLGFKAPNWVDEIVKRRGIDRQKDDLTEIEQALRDEVWQHHTLLLNVIESSVRTAHALGYAVIESDLRAMARQLRDAKFDYRPFYEHMRDPRGDL